MKQLMTLRNQLKRMIEDSENLSLEAAKYRNYQKAYKHYEQGMGMALCLIEVEKQIKIFKGLLHL